MPKYDGGSCWEANAETWTRQARAGYDIYRDNLNTPAFLAMLPPIAGLKGLDVGCGEGSNTRSLAKLGANMSAIDIAPTFIRHALSREAAEPLGIDFAVGDALALPFPDASFDFVTAFMSLMDVPDPEAALAEAHRVLRHGGFVQFSIMHPCFAPPHRRVVRDENGTVQTIEVAEYFAVGEYLQSWWFSTTPEEERGQVEPFRIPSVHLTLSMWFDVLCRTGFAIRRLGEPSATAGMAEAIPALADTRVAPLFLHVQAGKA